MKKRITPLAIFFLFFSATVFNGQADSKRVPLRPSINFTDGASFARPFTPKNVPAKAPPLVKTQPPKVSMESDQSSCKKAQLECYDQMLKYLGGTPFGSLSCFKGGVLNPEWKPLLTYPFPEIYAVYVDGIAKMNELKCNDYVVCDEKDQSFSTNHKVTLMTRQDITVDLICSGPSNDPTSVITYSKCYGNVSVDSIVFNEKLKPTVFLCKDNGEIVEIDFDKKLSYDANNKSCLIHNSDGSVTEVADSVSYQDVGDENTCFELDSFGAKGKKLCFWALVSPGTFFSLELNKWACTLHYNIK